MEPFFGHVQIYLLSIHQTNGEPFAPLSMQLVSVASDLDGESSGSIYGHPCATNALSVAAIPHVSLPKPRPICVGR